MTVCILFDEGGGVVEAEAVGGHTLPHDASVAAARRATFTPTRVSGRPVRVSGLIV